MGEAGKRIDGLRVEPEPGGRGGGGSIGAGGGTFVDGPERCEPEAPPPRRLVLGDCCGDGVGDGRRGGSGGGGIVGGGGAAEFAVGGDLRRLDALVFEAPPVAGSSASFDSLRTGTMSLCAELLESAPKSITSSSAGSDVLAVWTERAPDDAFDVEVALDGPPERALALMEAAAAAAADAPLMIGECESWSNTTCSVPLISARQNGHRWFAPSPLSSHCVRHAEHSRWPHGSIFTSCTAHHKRFSILYVLQTVLV